MSARDRGQLTLPFFDPPGLLQALPDRSSFHLLRRLTLPDRFEKLDAILGPRIVELLVEPPPELTDLLREAADHATARGEGSFVPLLGQTGVGKTTLANCIDAFFPDRFGQALRYESETYGRELTLKSLGEAVTHYLEDRSSADGRLVPVVVDHRESDAPSQAELSRIKQFLRDPRLGARCFIFWPEVTEAIANDMSRRYRQIAGASVISLPVRVTGPPRTTWQDIAKNTMEVVNQVPSIEELGIRPRDYNPFNFLTLGEFLRKISIDFAQSMNALLSSTSKPLNMAILFVSGSYNAGVLSQLTTGTHYGLLDSGALLSATPNSDEGRWWAPRRGRLTQTIYRLNARAFCLPPSTAVAILRCYGSQEVNKRLAEAGRQEVSPAQVNHYLTRTDIGKYLLGEHTGTYEARGRPPEKARIMLDAVAERGYGQGVDKALNAHLAKAIQALLRASGVEFDLVTAERKLDFCELIPDVAVHKDTEVMCVEVTWRKGDFLRSTNRASAAQYILSKIKGYALALRWAAP